ncbi:MAG: NitT/TauT family transport system permease protein [Planctomycetota bacterium]|jgi:NitT/TauT family transport system permease protein
MMLSIPAFILAALLLRFMPRLPKRAADILAPLAVAVMATAIWSVMVELSETNTFPSPSATWFGLLELIESQRLWGDIVASLFRVSWGFFMAASVAIPLGMVLGWSTRSFQALNPLIQLLRPISPIAWIPIAILWFGIGDGAGIYLIFLSTFFPITVGTTAAVRNISLVHQRSAQNFGLEGMELFRHVVFPAALPQIIVSLRIALGVAWLVIVAAEMVGMQSGLGYLINDARNAGSRYDLVVATMLVIGLLGIILDLMIRQLEKFDEVRWGYVNR